MNTNEAVDEVIAEETEMPVMSWQEARNEIERLNIVIRRLGEKLLEAHIALDERNQRINRMLELNKIVVDDMAYRADYIIEQMTETGTHADRSRAALEAIRLLVRLARSMAWEHGRLVQAAEGGKPDIHEMEDIPF